MVQYRTNAGERRKPSLGLFSELTVEQARTLAQNWLAEVRRGGDPGRKKAEARKAPIVAELCTRCMEDYSKTRNKPSTQRSYQHKIDRSIIPAFGNMKVADVTRLDVTALMKRKEKSPIQANRVLGRIRKMFDLAELWGYRPDGFNPCRHVPKHPEKGKTRLITDAQMALLFAYLERADVEGLEPSDADSGYPPAVRVRHPDVGDPAVGVGLDRPAQQARGLAGQQDWRHVQAHARGSAPALVGSSAPREFPLCLSIDLQSQEVADRQLLLPGMAARPQSRRRSPCRTARHPPSRGDGHRQLRCPREGRHGADRTQDGHACSCGTCTPRTIPFAQLPSW